MRETGFGAFGQRYARALRAIGADPAFFVGAEVPGVGEAGAAANAGWGEGEWVVAEADESDGSFLVLTPTIAVITNIGALQRYGLEVLATEIEDHPSETRFVVVGHGIPARTGHDKTSVVCFQREDRPGSLLAILQEFAARAINLTKLESRPAKRGLGEYCFFIDFEGVTRSPRVKRVE